MMIAFPLQPLATVADRIATARLIPVGHQDAGELLFWLVTGITVDHPVGIADIAAFHHHESWRAAFAFVVEHTRLARYLGLAATDQVGIAAEIHGWLTHQPWAGPIPRHFVVHLADQADPRRNGNEVRVRHKPASPYASTYPEDAL